MPSVLVTGGAGFIGINSAEYFSKKGWRVSIVDNLSRKGADINLKWLITDFADTRIFQVDIRNEEEINQVVRSTKPDMVLHLAAQVAVTTSYENPREDFEINAAGTFNVLEAVRKYSPESFFLYASTNKVYGGLENLPIVLGERGYKFRDLPLGVGESQPLDFHSPYGCSKGVADQYTIDYSRIYGLQTCAFRQSCIYGRRQFGIEDQGWVAWFSIAALLGKSITLYGDGWQTRDVLNVGDLVAAYEAAWIHRQKVNGHALNIGGGPNNTLCLRDLLSLLKKELMVDIIPRYGDSRPGDQPVFVCDIRKAKEMMGWEPKISVYNGVRELIDWVIDNKSILQECLSSQG
jgi:CDP-paratose 2-epimerase